MAPAVDSEFLVEEALAEIGAEVSAASSEAARAKICAIRARLFRHQLEVIDDPYRFKSVLCPRRSGKTYVVAAYLILTCLAQPEAECAFIAVTRTHAKRIIWKTLKQLNRKFDLGITFQNVELTANFPNGSSIGLHGAETEHDIEKFRGMPYDVIVIDEAASFAQSQIDYLVEEVLLPTLRDRLGTLVLAGTPGAICAGTFYQATSDESTAVLTRSDGKKRVRARPYADRERAEYQDTTYEWSFHRWSVADNTAQPEMWQRTLDDKERLGWIDEDPRWMREGLGKWVADDTGFVYRYDEHRNGWTPDPASKGPYGLPEGHEWHYVAGVDLGYDDDFDIEVFAFSDTCDTFFHVDGYSAPGLTVSQCAEEIKRFDQQFGGFLAIVCDSAGLGKQIIEEFRQVHGIKLETADKQGKRDWIEIWNSDLIAGRCKVRRNSTLARQMSVVQWDETKKREDKRFANHACDAGLYVRRYAFHHFSRPQTKEAQPGTVAWYREREREEMQRIVEQRRREREQQWFDSVAVDAPMPGLEDSTWGWS